LTFLLDVNVLIALVDPAHVSHDEAHRWFEATGAADWATCPLTELGLLRILSHPKYPNSAGSPTVVAPILARMKALSGHRFWPDDISLADHPSVDMTVLGASDRVTDTYLLALAAAKGGKLATFDQRLSTQPVRGGGGALCVIGGD
jgi:uncharacterized protein